MTINKPKNVNYCATVVSVSRIIKLENCDNVQGALVSGYNVIVSKDVKENDIGIFFPVECQLSKEYLSDNNLYRNKELNVDKEKAGYFDENGRLRCMKFRGNKSEGLFMPLSSLSFVGINTSELKVNDSFDELNNIPICKKYFVETRNTSGKNDKRQNKVKRISRMIENQFRLHIDTEQLKRNMFKINPNDIVSITAKMHGTSAVISKVMVRKQLTIKDRIAKYFGVNIVESEYDLIYASRNVIKNDNGDCCNYYATDLWKENANKIKDIIPNGITIYAEIVGYASANKHIQNGYHYGCDNETNELYVYRITFTNVDGKVFEFNRPQIDEFCKNAGLKTTPLFFYGYAKDIYPNIVVDEKWHDNVLSRLDADERFYMNNIMCPMNNKQVPAEGCVLRVEKLYDAEPYKLKNYKFLEWETKQIDNGEVDIETEESKEE